LDGSAWRYADQQRRARCGVCAHAGRCERRPNGGEAAKASKVDGAFLARAWEHWQQQARAKR